MKQIFSIKWHIQYLKFVINNIYSQKVKLNSLEGRLLVILIFWNKENIEGITGDSTLAELLKKLVNVDEKNSVIWQPALDELIKSKTIKHPEGTSNKVDEIKLCEIEVNEQIKHEVLNENFYKFAKKTRKDVNRFDLIKFNNEFKSIKGFDKTIKNSHKESDVENYEELVNEEQIDFMLSSNIKSNSELSLMEQDIETVDLVSGEVDLEFKIEGFTISPSDESTKVFLDNFSVDSDSKNETFQHLCDEFQKWDKEFVINDEGRKIVCSFDDNFIDEKIASSKKVSEDIYINTSKRAFAFRIVDEECWFEHNDIHIPVSVRGYEPLSDEEMLQILLKDSNFLDIDNLSDSLKKQIFYEIINSENKNERIITWIFESHILEDITIDELLMINDEAVINMLTSSQIQKLVKSDNKKRLKNILHIIYEALDAKTIFDYYGSIEEAKESGLLNDSSEFANYLMLVDKIDNFEIDQIKVTEEELSEAYDGFSRLERLSKPFTDNRLQTKLKEIKKVQERLFLPTFEENEERGHRIRKDLEAFIMEELKITSIEIGQFNKMVDKVSKLSRKQKDKIKKHYKTLGEASHKKILSEEEKENKIKKRIKQFDSIEKDINSIFIP